MNEADLVSKVTRNPLIPAILSVLRRNVQRGSGENFGIHHLLSALGCHPGLQNLDPNPELALFKKNFLMMNGLYQLQQSLWEDEGLVLAIATLNIQLNRPATDCATVLPETADPMRDYYLNWQHYAETSCDDVVTLLNGFWQWQPAQGRDEALQTLNLGPGASAEQVKQRYQRLASEHHPDKGGDPERFMAIRQAYEQLRL